MFNNAINESDNIRKYIVYFGNLFSKIRINRRDDEGSEVQNFLVPIVHGPKEKFLARLLGNTNNEKEIAIQLPAMSCELINYQLDTNRMLNKGTKLFGVDSETGNKIYYNAPMPYYYDFDLTIITKYQEDMARIIDQILPNFQPNITAQLQIVPGIDPIDIKMSLVGTAKSDTYEGPFTNRRELITTLRFTIEGWAFGPAIDATGKVITQVEVYTKITNNPQSTSNTHPNVQTLIIVPGQTANGEATTNPLLSVERNDVNPELPWDYIINYTEE